MQPGDLIAGKYRIDRILGQGGMGTVVAATNLLIDQPVALKFLLPELLKDPAVVERLLREARASARLRSEHVCLVYDVGNENGAPFIVMEMLTGRDLASMVSTRTVLPVPEVTDYILQAAVGLAEAHALGIVHRDLKPANLFLTRRLDGTPLIKVLDFGIAKAPSDAQFNLTRTAAVMGSPGYMSPEQLRSSRDADPRSDIWALGVILFELTAGRPPFVAESITELTLRVAVDPTPRLPGVPPAFEQVVARCLEKDPGRRFADVGQLAAALAPFGTGRAAEIAAGIASMLRASAVAPSPPVVTADSTPTTLGSSASSMPSLTVRRSQLPWGILAGSALVAAVAFVVAASRSGSATRPTVHVDAPAPRAPAPPGPPASGTAAADTAAAPPAGSPTVPAPPTTQAPPVVTSTPPTTQAPSLVTSAPPAASGAAASSPPTAKPSGVASAPPVMTSSPPAASGAPAPSSPTAKSRPAAASSSAPATGAPAAPSPAHKPQRGADAAAQQAPKLTPTKATPPTPPTPKPTPAKDIGASRE